MVTITPLLSTELSWKIEENTLYARKIIMVTVKKSSSLMYNVRVSIIRILYIYILHLFHFYIFHFFQHCREKFRSTGPSCILYADENRLAIMCGWRRSSRRRASRSCCDHVSYRSGRLANCFAV